MKSNPILLKKDLLIDPMQLVPNVAPPITPTEKPKQSLPRFACDSHAHIFGPLSQYPILPKTHFIPHLNPLEDYIKMLSTIGCERAVLVQPSVYGTNNTLMEEALRKNQFPLRAIAVVSADISDLELLRLHTLGFRGIRVNTASATSGLTLEDAKRLAPRLKELNWHMQFFVNVRKQPAIVDELIQLPINVVIDHYGCVDASLGKNSEGYMALMRLFSYEHVWAKISANYFSSMDFPLHRDVALIAQEMMKIMPERLVWGSDWPHVSAKNMLANDGHLVNLLLDWTASADLLQKILVDNPAHLYEFNQASQNPI